MSKKDFILYPYTHCVIFVARKGNKRDNYNFCNVLIIGTTWRSFKTLSTKRTTFQCLEQIRNVVHYHKLLQLQRL